MSTSVSRLTVQYNSVVIRNGEAMEEPEELIMFDSSNFDRQTTISMKAKVVDFCYRNWNIKRGVFATSFSGAAAGAVMLMNCGLSSCPSIELNSAMILTFASLSVMGLCCLDLQKQRQSRCICALP